MRLLAAVVALVPLASCDQASHATSPPATPDPSAAASRALAAVWISIDGSVIFDAFPRDVGSAACDIGGGGPYNAGIHAVGWCRTTVQRQASDWLVTFIETWDAATFHAIGSARTGPLTYIWQFTLDDAGRVVRQVHFGDFPPQLVM